MKVILSTTLDDQYLFYLPLAVWSWAKIGTTPIIFLPRLDEMTPNITEWKFELAYSYIRQDIIALDIKAPENKLATYLQCARLYAAAIKGLNENEILITSDIDMAVFGSYFNQANLDAVQIFGSDLVPENQYPICYISAPVRLWRQFMQIEPDKGYQYYLDELLGPIECDHFRANQWALDQDTVWKKIQASNLPVIKHKRAIFPHQFATLRADRDGWPNSPPEGIVDAHLPRPGYTEENFNKILTLFRQVYPDENFNFMIEYRNEYLKLL